MSDYFKVWTETAEPIEYPLFVDSKCFKCGHVFISSDKAAYKVNIDHYGQATLCPPCLEKANGTSK